MLKVRIEGEIGEGKTTVAQLIYDDLFRLGYNVKIEAHTPVHEQLIKTRIPYRQRRKIKPRPIIIIDTAK